MTTLKLQCPRCEKPRRFDCIEQVPVQRFDRKCCAEWVVTIRPLKRSAEMTIWEVEWDPTT